MKKYFIMALMCLSMSFCFSQVSVVTAPVLEAEAISQTGLITQQSAIISTMNGVVTALEKADREYKEAMQKATWLRNLQTAARILHMVENLVCTSKNLTIRMNSIGHGSCLMTYRFDMSIIQVQQSADYLGIILTAGVTMTAAERMKSLDDVINAFQEAQEMMVRLNRSLDSDITRLRLAKNTVAAADLVMNYDRSRKMR